MSLARGFQYAGVPSIVISHWPANDEGTAQIMADFYQALADGMGKDAALRFAKLKYLENADENTANPFYWATFSTLGNTRPLISKNAGFPWLLILPVLLTVGVVIVFMTKSKRAAKRF